MLTAEELSMLHVLAAVEGMRGTQVSAQVEVNEVLLAVGLIERGYLTVVHGYDHMRVMLTQLGRGVIHRARAAA